MLFLSRYVVPEFFGSRPIHIYSIRRQDFYTHIETMQSVETEERERETEREIVRKSVMICCGSLA